MAEQHHRQEPTARPIPQTAPAFHLLLYVTECSRWNLHALPFTTQFLRSAAPLNGDATSLLLPGMRPLLLALLILCCPLLSGAQSTIPIGLHPGNPHYFLFRGKPAVLIGSTEHYGAVLNGAFDNVKYLDTIHRDGMNLTRTFSGVYREVPGSFGITGNTLAPSPDRYVAPWPRTDTPGAEDGLAKFDLSKWNDAYFRRLTRFVKDASDRGIVVEFVLFCPFYEQRLWDGNPMNAKNNVNEVGDLPRDKVYTLHNGKLLEIQDAFARKAVSALRDFDNVYFEICNEPYFGGVTLDWQQHIAQIIADAEKDLPHKHLIAQNIANDWAKVDHPDPLVSIFNFHYANPPRAVTENFALNKVISYDETGFKGSDDTVYRVHGWEFVMAGGAVYDNLDYSFTTDTAGGTAKVPAPGGGSPALRHQLRTLKDFVVRFDFTKMKPMQLRDFGEGMTARGLAEEGQQYAIYIRRALPDKTHPKAPQPAPAEITMDLPAGDYQVEWIDPIAGTTILNQSVHAAGRQALGSPPFAQDIALRLVRK